MALVWGFGPAFSSRKDDSDFALLVKGLIDRLQLRGELDLDKLAIYDLCVDPERVRLRTYGEAPGTETGSNDYIRTKETARYEGLAAALLPQGECMAFVGPDSCGKASLIRHLLSLHAEQLAIGQMYASPLLDSETARRYIDSFYVVKKRHVATPASWKSVLFFVQDIHMSYPTSTFNLGESVVDTQLIELFRLWMAAKGFYDLATMRFKSVSSFSLVFSAEGAQTDSAAHLQRLLNGCVRVPMPEGESLSELRGLFVTRWVASALPDAGYHFHHANEYREDVRKKCLSVLGKFLQPAAELAPSLRLIHTFCSGLGQTCPKHSATSESAVSAVLFSEALTVFLGRRTPDSRDRLEKRLRESVAQAFPTFSAADDTVLGNYHQATEMEFSPGLFSLSSLRPVLQSILSGASDKLSRAVISQFCFSV